MTILLSKPIPAERTTAGSQTCIIAHIIYFKAIERDFFHHPSQIFFVHIKESGIVVTKCLHLVLPGITPASVAYINFADIFEKVTLVLGMFGCYRIMKQQYMMTLTPVQFLEFSLIPWPFNVITRIMVHEFYAIFV